MECSYFKSYDVIEWRTQGRFPVAAKGLLLVGDVSFFASEIASFLIISLMFLYYAFIFYHFQISVSFYF